jgi:DNA polymerase III subunit epsilon
MSDRIRIGLALLAAWGLVVAAIAAILLLVGADLGDEQRTVLVAIVQERAASVILVSLLLIAPLVVILKVLFARYVTAPRQLAEDIRITTTANPGHRARPRGSAEIRRLAERFNAFADAHEGLKRDVEQRVREANDRIEQEKNRLAALMSELAQSVIVCNSEGRVLLYNARAMQLLRQPVGAGAGGGKGHALIGLGRSIFAVFDRNVIIHALESVADRLGQGARNPVANFVTTTPGGQLLRVQLAPVLGAAAPTDGAVAADGITGFVLILDNITRQIETGNRRGLLVQTLTQGTRASLASMRAAVETIVSFPDMARDAQDRFIGIIGDEARQLSERLDQTVGEFADSLRTEWPLVDMRGADLIAAARRRIETKLGLPTAPT